MSKIGIAYTVHDRHPQAKKAIANAKKFLPPSAVLVIVDDASKTPYSGATYRFEKNVGISVAKNKCLELLTNAGCTDLFLFDDDTWPKVDKWWDQYVNSPEKHLMFTFSELKDGRPNGNRIVVSTGDLVEFQNPCGCLLYVTKSVLDVVGGFDTRFVKYSHEHVEWSNRIHNAGLTKFRFQDVPNSIKLFHSMDWACETLSSVLDKREVYIAVNYTHLSKVRDSREFIPYKPLAHYVVTCAITSLVDPQHGTPRSDVDTSEWQKSISENSDAVIAVISDQDTPPQHPNPYFARWFYYRDYVASLDACSYIWLTDGTDVTMLRDPFPHMKLGMLYVGDERGSTLQNQWLRKHHDHEFYQGMCDTPLPLLNAGICGGDRNTVLEFCEIMCSRAWLEGQLTDMAMFNYTAYIDFKGSFLHGEQVNTVFKRYMDNGIAWFMHK